MQLLRLLLENGIRPILLVAFTNHALDHILGSVLDAGITDIVRLGRSSDDRISQRSLDAIELDADRSNLRDDVDYAYRQLRSAEEDIKSLLFDFQEETVDSDHILAHMEIAYPNHFESFTATPQWIEDIHSQQSVDDGQGFWKPGHRKRDYEVPDDSLYAFWLVGGDISFLEHVHTHPHVVQQQRLPAGAAATRGPFGLQNRYDTLSDNAPGESDMFNSPSLGVGSREDEGLSGDEGSDPVEPEEAWRAVDDPDDSDDEPADLNTHVTPTSSIAELPAQTPRKVLVFAQGESGQPAAFHDVVDFFSARGMLRAPYVPRQDRSLHVLLDEDDVNVWTFSRVERQRFHSFFKTEVRASLQRSRIEQFETLRQCHRDALTEYNEGMAEVSITTFSLRRIVSSSALDP